MTDPLAIVIENDKSTSDTIGTILEEEGFEVEVFSDGRAAVDRIDQKMPELVTIDLDLRSISGEAIARYIRGNEKLNQIPIIVTTNDADRAAAMKPYVAAVWTEPYHLN